MESKIIDYVKNPIITKNMDVYSCIANVAQEYPIRVTFYNNDGETHTAQFLHTYQKLLNRGVSVNEHLLQELSDDAKMCYNSFCTEFKKRTGKTCPLKFISEDTNCEIVGVNNRHNIYIKRIYEILDKKFNTGPDFEAK